MAYKGNGLLRVGARAGVGTPLGFSLGLGLGFGLGFGLGLSLGLRLGLGLVLGLGSSRDDLDDHFRRPQPTYPNSDLPGTTHSDHESRVYVE